MKETIQTILDLLKDRNYEMTPDINKLLTTLVEDLDIEVDSLGELVTQMQEDMEVVIEAKTVEYVQHCTGLSKAVILNDYGQFKLIQSIEDQLQHNMN